MSAFDHLDDLSVYSDALEVYVIYLLFNGLQSHLHGELIWTGMTDNMGLGRIHG